MGLLLGLEVTTIVPLQPVALSLSTVLDSILWYKVYSAGWPRKLEMRNFAALTIGKAAEQGGVNVQTIRYYERRGLLPKPARTASGYRKYSDEAIRRLRFIRQAQALGFSLSEIEELLSLRMQPGTTCGDIRQRARQKIATVNTKMDELQRIKDALGKLAKACRGKGPTSECPILEALERERN